MAKYRWLATLLLLPLIQCQDNSVTGPDVPDEVRATAIRLHVDVAARTVTQVNTLSNGDISLSLVGEDAVSLQTSSLSQTALGKNKVRVQFDVAITNSLTNVTLVHPQATASPSGTTGILLFPLEATATTGSGVITASSDWDGDPFNFLSGGACKGSAANCYRWEEYTPSLTSGATTAARTVGFEMDKSITEFDVVMLVAADLENVAAAPAAIALSQSTANFQYTGGNLSPSSISISVSNSGGGTLGGLTTNVTYAAGQPTGWLIANLSSTTAPASLDVSAAGLSLDDGTYNATVAISSAGVSNSPQNVSVTLVVSGAAVATAIYVSESDPAAIDDANCGLGPVFSGTGNHPCRTITQGLARATVTGRGELRVADGRYTEAVNLVNGKNLLGGYQADTWQRHLSTTNTIIDGVSSSGNHDRTVVASSITSPTVFEGFVVRGSSNAKTGGNSYAIYVSSSNANLVIRNNSIYGGVGGPGAQGSAGASGAQGANGTGRDSDAAAYDSKIAAGSGQCDASNNRSYSNGAVGLAGADNIGGGNGGGNVCPPSSTFTRQSAQNGVIGFAGDPSGGGSAGALGNGGLDFKYDPNGISGQICYVASSGTHAGGNGGPGGNGQHGPPVLGAVDAAGSVVGGHWVGASGVAGITGGNGGGGGGGGAGGGAYSMSTASKDRLGGVGGGGGAGGAGGGGGGAGSAGGSAFGIFIVGSAPVVTNNTIIRGTGGNGGSGGGGAAGALGGQGGAGGLAAVFCTEAGGRGGDGGKGGTGSGGGGGSGGASFGIYTSGAGTPSYCTSDNNPISGGAPGVGGQGGASQVNAGGSGVAGTLATCSYH